jgi:hypothetical protein
MASAVGRVRIPVPLISTPHLNCPHLFLGFPHLAVPPTLDDLTNQHRGPMQTTATPTASSEWAQPCSHRPSVRIAKIVGKAFYPQYLPSQRSGFKLWPIPIAIEDSQQ